MGRESSKAFMGRKMATGYLLVGIVSGGLSAFFTFDATESAFLTILAYSLGGAFACLFTAYCAYACGERKNGSSQKPQS